MGRPRTDPAIRDSIVRWAENQPDMPSLSEAIRRLVELWAEGEIEVTANLRPSIFTIMIDGKPREAFELCRVF